MISIALQILGIFACAVLLTQIFTGCSISEAIAKVQSIFKQNEKIIIPLASDRGFYNEICQGLNGVIGDKRYGELAKLDAALRASGKMPVIDCSTNSGLPCITITVQPKDDSEKQILEAVLTGIFQEKLVARGLGPAVLADWRKRMDINFPCLEIRYPDNERDMKVILDAIARDGFTAIGANTSLTDDTDF